ncbi:MAG: hypothetical protein ACPGDB_04255 [Fusobacterium sp.]
MFGKKIESKQQKSISDKGPSVKTQSKKYESYTNDLEQTATLFNKLVPRGEAHPHLVVIKPNNIFSPETLVKSVKQLRALWKKSYRPKIVNKKLVIIYTNITKSNDEKESN